MALIRTGCGCSTIALAATCHTANEIIELLQTRFGDKLISRNGLVKSLVYANNPATLEALEANIVRVLQDIWPPLLEKVTQNWSDRMLFVRNSRGGHMP